MGKLLLWIFFLLVLHGHESLNASLHMVLALYNIYKYVQNDTERDSDIDSEREWEMERERRVKEHDETWL